jgi:hypothetical protein
VRAAWVLVLAACAGDAAGPHLVSVTPAAAARAARVMIAGERLCGPTADCTHVGATVQLGLTLPMIDAAVESYAAASATIVVPNAAPIGATEIVVTVDGRSSNALAFEVLP